MQASDDVMTLVARGETQDGQYSEQDRSIILVARLETSNYQKLVTRCL